MYLYATVWKTNAAFTFPEVFVEARVDYRVKGAVSVGKKYGKILERVIPPRQLE